MSLAELDLSSMSSGEFVLVDPERVADIDRKQRQIADFLTEHGYDALLLTRPANFSWFTTGGVATRGNWEEPTAALFLNRDARVVLTWSPDSGQLFDREIPRLGFQLKERPWQESAQVLLSDLCRGRNAACDQPFETCADVSLHVSGMRLPLSVYERRVIQELGWQVSRAVEATARKFQRGDSAAEIAGQVAHRLIREGIQPVRLQVLADGQGRRYRHWSYGPETVERYCTIAAVGRKQGLHAGVSRTVSFGIPPQDVRQAHFDCLLVQATGLFFSKPRWELFETWNRVQRIYEKFGNAEEWHVCDQGCVTGYELCEAPIVPRSQYRLAADMPVFWHPSIGPALVADTILVRDAGFEVLTPTDAWPQVEVNVKQIKISRPDILVRP